MMIELMILSYYSLLKLGNHDGSRIGTRMGQEKIDLFNALVTLLPGTSVTYYVSYKTYMMFLEYIIFVIFTRVMKLE